MPRCATRSSSAPSGSMRASAATPASTPICPGSSPRARDFGGHGTHTASTAGGNTGVPATGAAAVFGTISGIAPHARIAAYKALWEQGDGTGSGTTSDLRRRD